MNRKSNGVTLRPPLYNAEDYIAALKLLFSSHCQPSTSSDLQYNHKNTSVIEHSAPGNPPHTSSTTPSPRNRRERESPSTPPEMSMRKFLNGSELLFKLEADLRHAYPTFVQEFISAHCEGVLHTLEALKLIQIALDEVNGLREQRKLFMDEQKCLQCLRLCLRWAPVESFFLQFHNLQKLKLAEPLSLWLWEILPWLRRWGTVIRNKNKSKKNCISSLRSFIVKSQINQNLLIPFNMTKFPFSLWQKYWSRVQIVNVPWRSVSNCCCNGVNSDSNTNSGTWGMSQNIAPF